MIAKGETLSIFFPGMVFNAYVRPCELGDGRPDSQPIFYVTKKPEFSSRFVLPSPWGGDGQTEKKAEGRGGILSFPFPPRPLRRIA